MYKVTSIFDKVLRTGLTQIWPKFKKGCQNLFHPTQNQEIIYFLNPNLITLIEPEPASRPIYEKASP